MMGKLPGKTVERLSQYRRVLLNIPKDKEHIFSYEIAAIIHNTPEQVRRDLMLIGYSGKVKKGYSVKDLISLIDNILDTPLGMKVAIIGMGKLGQAVNTYFSHKREKLNIVAAFDVDENKVGKRFSGVPCYAIADLKTKLQEEKLEIAILSLPASKVKEVAEVLVDNGIKGIMNYTTTPLNVPDYVHLEEYDMITTLEKVAYFVKK